MNDIITLDEQEKSEDFKGENNLSNCEDHFETLEKEIVELEEISLAESSSECSSAFFALENNSKALSKRSWAAAQMSCDKLNEPSFKTLKMSNPMTLDENEDIIEVD